MQSEAWCVRHETDQNLIFPKRCCIYCCRLLDQRAVVYCCGHQLIMEQVSWGHPIFISVLINRITQVEGLTWIYGQYTISNSARHQDV